jgi:hypothetical protein
VPVELIRNQGSQRLFERPLVPVDRKLKLVSTARTLAAPGSVIASVWS